MQLFNLLCGSQLFKICIKFKFLPVVYKFLFSHLIFPEKLDFSLVFIIPLRNVDEDISLAEVIKVYHGLEKIPTSHIENILEGQTKNKVLVILDGYDEYTKDTNKEIDAAIEKPYNDFTLIVTSRPGKDPKDETFITKKIRDKMDRQVIIQGFSDENIEKCAELFLESKEKSKTMLGQLKTMTDVGLYELLRTPITLLMMCVLFEGQKEKREKAKTRTEIYELIYELSMDRTTIKSDKFGCKSAEIHNIKELRYKLGKLAWESLGNNIRQLLLSKVKLQISNGLLKIFQRCHQVTSILASRF